MTQQDIHLPDTPSPRGQQRGEETPHPNQPDTPADGSPANEPQSSAADRDEECDEPLVSGKGLPGRTGLYYRIVDWLLEHQGSPHSVALGVAVGVFVALTPTVGFQMILGATIAHFLKANRVLAASMAWITNPATIVPIYYFNYRVGLFFVGGDPEKGKRFIESLKAVSLLDFEHFLSTMRVMLGNLAGIAGVLWLGSLIVAAVAAAISYPVVRRIVEVERCKLAALRKKVAKKLNT